MARNNLSLIVLNTKKSAIWRFFLLFLFCLPTLLAAQNCPSSHYDESATVKYTHDGDTVKLTDGRKIRLIGINTPEVAKDGQPAEAYSLQARDRLRSLLASSNNRVKLIHGNEAKDHYQRSLAHLFLPDGTNLQSHLLSSGLATAITIPPNDSFTECYQQAEKYALCAKKNLWSHDIQNITDLGETATGFRVLSGKLKSIQASSKGFWLELKDGLSLRIAFQHKSLFDMKRLHSLIDQVVVVRGWLQIKKKPKQGQRFYMQLKHPSVIEQEKLALKC